MKFENRRDLTVYFAVWGKGKGSLITCPVIN